MENNILVMGLAGTGKTTFIAALWAYLTEDIPEKELTLHSLVDGDSKYLNEITRQWLTCNRIQRNLKTESHKDIRMNLKVVGDGSEIDLNIPDIAGETFQEHFDIRKWSKSYDETIARTTGVLLFVSPLTPNNKPALILDALEITREMDENLVDSESDSSFEDDGAARTNETEQASTNGNSLVVEVVDKVDVLGAESFGGNASKSKAEKGSVDTELIDDINGVAAFTPYNPELTCNQVKIIEELQFIAFHHPKVIPVKVAVMVSAWDQLISPVVDLSPEDWLNINMPLLYQFIKCNSGKFTVDFFGVSAQGVDYDDENEVRKKFGTLPQDRIIIQKNHDRSHNITMPIMWVLR